MAIDRMKKVAIFGMADEFARIAHGLQRLSMLHISAIEPVEDVEHDDGGDTLTRADKRLSEVENALTAIKPYFEGGRGMLSPKPVLTEAELEAADNEENWDIVRRATNVCQQIPSLRSRYLQAQNTLLSLRPFERFDADVEDIKSSRLAFMALGTIPEVSYAALVDGAQALDAVVQSVELINDMRTVFFVCINEQTERAHALMQDAGFVEAKFSFSGTVKGEQARLNQQMDDIQQQIEQAQQDLANLAEHTPALEALFDSCTVQRQRAALALESGRTGKAFYLTGWVREKQADKLTDALIRLSDAIVVDFPERKEGEMPPTAMRNSRLLKPFESITEMYSMPTPYEADPTWIMAPFFLCFFGMMMSDAAYGIIMTIGALLMMKLAKPGGMMGQIVAVIAMGGIATLLWGIVFGGWFGAPLLPPLWFNPLDEPITMLILCLALGFLQITVGIFMRAAALFKEKKYLAILFDCGFVLCVLWGAVAAMVGLSFGMTLALVGAIGMFLTAGREKPKIMSKFVGGFSAVYGLTGYMSDILSYSRLFGMGLATGIIAMVFNTIAGMLMGNPIGIVFAIIVLIIGHTFNIAINALGAYVHSCRLQYIEFYSRFFEGGGRVFVPFTFKTKYVHLNQG